MIASLRLVIALLGISLAGQARADVPLPPGLAAMAASPGSNESVITNVGGLDLELNMGRTAFVFAAVDEMSRWTPRYKPSYHEWLDRRHVLTNQERLLLTDHERLRRALPERGFYLSFGTNDSIEVATRRSELNHWLKVADASSERAVLDHFAPLFAPLYDERRARLGEFRDRLLGDAKVLDTTIRQLTRFAGGMPEQPLTLVLVAAPNGSEGGNVSGINGTPQLIEMSDESDRGVRHAIARAFINLHASRLGLAAAQCGSGLEPLELSRALVLAYLDDQNDLRDPEIDLQRSVARGNVRSDGSRDPWVRSGRYSIVLRRRVHAALREGKTLEELLPATCEPWKKLVADGLIPPPVTQTDLMSKNDGKRRRD